MATDVFLTGCVDKHAALTVMDKHYDSLDQAVQPVRRAVSNQKVIKSTRRAEIKQVSFMEQNDENVDIKKKSYIQFDNFKALSRKHSISL